MAKRTVLRVLVTLHFLKINVTELLAFLNSLIQKLPGDPDVTNPIVPVSTLQSQYNALNSTVTQRITNKAKSLTNLENQQVNDVLDSCTYLANQVEQIANVKANGDIAVALEVINRLGFVAKNKGVMPGRFFECYKTEAPGKAWLRCPASSKKSAIYLWRYTDNVASQQWSPAMQTSVSTVNLVELTGDKRYYFQYAVIENAGKGNVIDVNNPQISWSDPVSALIPA